MSETTPRQVLYALVAGGFLIVVLVLVVGAAIAGLVPNWWTVVMGLLIASIGAWSAINWKRTGPVLLLSISLFVIWTVGTLVVA